MQNSLLQNQNEISYFHILGSDRELSSSRILNSEHGHVAVCSGDYICHWFWALYFLFLFGVELCGWKKQTGLLSKYLNLFLPVIT